jgi:hypothetical protein
VTADAVWCAPLTAMSMAPPSQLGPRPATRSPPLGAVVGMDAHDLPATALALRSRVSGSRQRAGESGAATTVPSVATRSPSGCQSYLVRQSTAKKLWLLIDLGGVNPTGHLVALSW